MRGLRVGTSGWSYTDWLGGFYAPGTPPGEFLGAYARVFDTVEVDSSYYRAPDRALTARWAAATPDGFLFCPKVPAEIVLDKRLDGVERATDAFLDGLVPLERAGRLGPVVLQLPPSLGRDEAEKGLRTFLDLVPRRIDLAVEFRHASWLVPDTYDALRGRGAALVWSWTHHGTTPAELTADWTYARAIGDRALTRFDRTQRDVTPVLSDAVARLRAAGARLVRAFFIANNHVGGFAPETVQAFQRLAGLPVADLARAARPPGQRGLGEFS